MEILVVEDEVRLAQHISRALTEAGHEPVVVHDGETALAKTELKRGPSDCARRDAARDGWLRSAATFARDENLTLVYLS